MALLLQEMRVKQVEVEGLFGLFHHRVDLRLDEHITLIHGPNGYGKTILLRLIAGFLTGDYELFRSIQLKSFSITFEDGSHLRLERREGRQSQQAIMFDEDTDADAKATLSITSSAVAQPFILPRLKRAPTPALREIEQHLPHLARRGPDQWLDMRTGDRLTLREILDRYSGDLPSHLLVNPLREHTPAWLWDVLDPVQVKLIQTQRLEVISNGHSKLSSRHGAYVPTVINYSDELTASIKQLLASYAARAQELDRTFPTRLLNQAESPLSASELREQLAALERKRIHLTELGFLDPKQGIDLPSSQAVEEKRDVLSVYVRDVEQKFSVFDEMAAKIELLIDIVNDRFLYKRMSIDRNQGFVFTSATGEQVPPGALSSGEQHQLVLLYELLFKSRPGSLVLIDEPEISLHIAWQERFLDDLAKMVRLSGFDAVIATHSPEVIGEHWDLVSELKGPELAAPRLEQSA